MLRLHQLQVPSATRIEMKELHTPVFALWTVANITLKGIHPLSFLRILVLHP